MVIVYKQISASKYHSNHVCDGYVKYGVYDRDIAVASVDQLRQPINTTVKHTIINGVSTTYSGGCRTYYLYGPVTQCFTQWNDADGIYLTYLRETRDCTKYASVGVIHSGYDPLYHGKPERLVHQRTSGKNSYSIHIFGYNTKISRRTCILKT